MKYMLMHKDIAVLEFSFSEQRRWARIVDVLNALMYLLICLCSLIIGNVL